MAMAVQKLYPDAKVTIGPWIENGFYYDFDVEPLTDKDLKRIKKEMVSILTYSYHDYLFVVYLFLLFIFGLSWTYRMEAYKLWKLFISLWFQGTEFICYIICRIGSLLEIYRL